MEDKFENIKSYINDVMSDKTNNTLGDWISDYGGVVNENYTITFGSHFALQKMLDRRDKEVIRIALSHAINSHDELVAEVERLRGENEALMKCRMAAREFFNSTVASGGSVKVSSTSKTALDEADKASDWLEAELKATADLVNK